MSPEQSPREPGVQASLRPSVIVRYWAAARAAAGRDEDRIQADTVADALAAVGAIHRDHASFIRVLSISSLLLGDRPVRRDATGTSLSDGDVIEVLPPFAGG